MELFVTIFQTRKPERMATAKVYPDALETLNKWYDDGHLICFLPLEWNLIEK